MLVGRFRFAAKTACGMKSWASTTSEWYPYQRWQTNYCVEPRRRIGRPAKRWHDQTQFSAQEIFLISINDETWSSLWENFCTVMLGTLVFGGSSCFMSLADRSFDPDGNCVVCVFVFTRGGKTYMHGTEIHT